MRLCSVTGLWAVRGLLAVRAEPGRASVRGSSCSWSR